jgi:Mycothiol maleylpyruvate isomerase N-terminal domain
LAHPIDREISVPIVEPGAPHDHPFDAEIGAERAGWHELLELLDSLDDAEIVRPGYYRDPDWSVADLVAHLGTWLAQAGIQLRRIEAGTYRPRDLDIEALNAEFRAAMSGQPWEVILTQAQASRHRMLEVWYALPSRTDAAAWWVAKAGAEHYREHLGRFRSWVATLQTDSNRQPA